MKKRMLSLLLAIVLCLSLLPTAALADGTDSAAGTAAIQLGTGGLQSPTATETETGTYCTPNSYVYFGTNDEMPIKWRVLDADKTSDDNDGVFLLSEQLLAKDVQFHSDDSSNVWAGSYAQVWCEDFAQAAFSNAENDAILYTSKEESGGWAFGAKTTGGVKFNSNKLTDEKVFFLSAKEAESYLGSYDRAPHLSAADGNGNSASWWLRSPYPGDQPGDVQVGLVQADGAVTADTVTEGYAARPALNLYADKVLLISPARPGSGFGCGTVDTYTGSEWKLTLTDDDHEDFTAKTTEVNDNGLYISYQNAQTGDNEYLSVLVTDAQNNVTWYDRLPLTAGSESAPEYITLPGGFDKEKNKIYVFNEQDNGDYKTNYASDLVELSFTPEGGEEFSVESITAAGNGRGNWLNGAEYSYDTPTNKMEETSQDVYEITYQNVAASGEDNDYEVCFVTTGNWTHTWGAAYDEEYELLPGVAAYNGENIHFSVAEDNSTVELVLNLSQFDFETKQGATYSITITPPASSEPSPVYVGGVQLLADTKYVNDADNGVAVSGSEEYNAIVTRNDTEGWTLALKGLDVTGETNEEQFSYKSSAIYTETDKLTIIVEEDSAVTGAQTTIHSAGVYAKGNLTITGTGTLTANGGAATSKSSGSYGVKCDGALTIENTVLNASGGNAGDSSVGVFASSITISGDDTVVTTSGGEGKWASTGIKSTAVYIFLNGGKVQAQSLGSNATIKKAVENPFKTTVSGKEPEYTDESGTVKTDYNKVSDKTTLTVTLGDPAPVYKTVTFYTRGGSLTGEGITEGTKNAAYTMQYQVGVGISELPKPTRDGYTFVGWYSNPDFAAGSGPDGSIGEDSNMNFIYYAKWAQYAAYVETPGESPHTRYFSSLDDAIAAAQDGDTVGLLADQASANISSGSFVLDLNGHQLQKLTVRDFTAAVKLADAKWGTGQIGSITTIGPIRDLCQDGYSLKIADTWASADQLSGTTLIGSIRVYALPITRVTASVDIEELPFGYTQTATLTAHAEMASAPYYSEAVPSYQWCSITYVGGRPVVRPAAEGESYQFPAGQPAGTYTFVCYASYDGVSFRSNDVTVHVAPDMRKTVSFSGVEDNQTFVYDGTAKTPEGTLTVSDGMSLSSLAVQYEKVENENVSRISDAPVNAGSYRITYSVPDSNAYYQGSVTYSFTIMPRRITVTAKNQSVYVGAEAPALDESSYTVSGLIDGEQLKKEPTVKYVDKDGNEILPDMTRTGSTIIRPSGAEASENYKIFYEDGTLTVRRRSSPSSTGSSASTYPITVKDSKNGSAASSHISAGAGTTVTITVTPDNGYTLETLTILDEDGNALKLTDNGSGRYVFTMPASGVTVTATFMDDNTMLNFFVDVKNGDYFYDAVLWAAQEGITTGMDAVHFSPNAPCTRAQIVTFLWRAAGSPVVDYAMNMTDVSEDDYYAEAVRWALSEGITTGTTESTFSPNEICTRAQAVTFLCRSQKAAAEGGMAVREFTDFSSIPAYAVDAIQWALENHVTTGAGDGSFAPNAACTRAQIVTFLYRLHLSKQDAGR